MKTKSLLIAALVVFSASVSTVSAIGNEEPTKTGLAIVPVKGSQVFKVIYKTENAGTTKLKVYNAESKVIFTETFSSANGFILPLNFSGLKAGEYTIELSDANGTKTETINFQPIALSSLSVHVSKLNEDGKFLLAVGNSNNEKINIRIYDSSNNLLHNENKELNGDFAQVYSLKSPSTSYTFEISDNKGNSKVVTF